MGDIQTQGAMRILYGIQGTGNGHITRSMQVIDLLRSKHKVEVDVLVSGSQNGMAHLLSPKYNFRGFNLIYDKKGRVKYTKTFFASDLFGFMEDLQKVRFKDYDLVVSDFEPITAYGAKANGVPCIGVSNQNYIKKKTKNPLKKLFLHIFSPTDRDLSLHFFEGEESGTFGPVVDLNLSGNTSKGERVLVYLPYIELGQLISILESLKIPQGLSGFDIFHPEAKSYRSEKGNMLVMPINRTEFVTRLKKCYGIMTNCGFSTVSEALFLNKKIWCMPLGKQFEQEFNSRKLKDKGYFVTKTISQKSMNEWLTHNQPDDSMTKNSAHKLANEIVRIMNLNRSRVEA